MVTIDDVIKNNHFICKQGIKEKDKDRKKNKNKEIDVSSLVGLNYIVTKKVKKFCINSNDAKWELSKVGYIYRDKHQNIVTDLYKAPILLITGGTTVDLRAVSAISYSDGVFKSSLTGIRGVGNSDISILRDIMGVLNSSFFAYYNILTFSSSGIEREETHDSEKWSVPYCKGLDKVVGVVENTTAEFYNTVMKDSLKKQQINSQIKLIDDQICNLFHCSDVEKDLIDYALQVSIPLAIKPKGYQHIFRAVRLNDKILKDYAQVYINHFAKSFNRNGKRFVVEIQYSNQIIGMFFKIVDDNESLDDILFLPNDNVLSSVMALLSSEKVTEQLFVQKDIRGFERDYFYIFKPNEKRLWHKAIAYLDVNEFDNAMLRVGRSKNDDKF